MKVVGLNDEDLLHLTASTGEKFVIRRATSEDKEALCRVCLLTGDGGKDATSQFRDPLLLGRRWVLPYVSLEPSMALCLVSEDNKEVCGYALGCLDTVNFANKLKKTYLPQMQELYPIDYHVEGPFRDSEVVKDFHSFELPPESVYTKFPSHMHIDLVPRVQGVQLGRSLLGTLLHTIREQGGTMIHLEMHKDNERAKNFYRRCAFRPLCQCGDDLYLGLNATLPKQGLVSIPGGVIVRVMALPVCLWDWSEANLRVGEPYNAEVAQRADLLFCSFLVRREKEEELWSRFAMLGEHPRLQYSSAHFLWNKGKERIPIGLCITAVMLLQSLSHVSRELRASALSAADLLRLAPCVPEVLKSCQAAVDQPIRDPTAACGVLQDVLNSLRREEEEEEETTLNLPGLFTFHGAPDAATVELVATFLRGLLL